tara:strand:- start:192 stop:383 length:192 start_codon:yes stop_codon:yes gene_type:complete
MPKNTIIYLEDSTMLALNFNSNFQTADEQIDALAFYDSLINGFSDLEDLTIDQINDLIDNLQF